MSDGKVTPEPFPVGTVYEGAKVVEVVEHDPRDAEQPFQYRLEGHPELQWIPRDYKPDTAAEQKTVRVVVRETVLRTAAFDIAVGPGDDIAELAREAANDSSSADWTTLDGCGYQLGFKNPFTGADVAVDDEEEGEPDGEEA